jgi:hypothetical protein
VTRSGCEGGGGSGLARSGSGGSGYDKVRVRWVSAGPFLVSLGYEHFRQGWVWKILGQAEKN